MLETTGPLSGTTLGRYRVGQLIGRGGMGEVYRAEDLELRRAVALKVLPEALVADADRLSRFVQEARTASALNHPHVVAIYEIGQSVPSGSAGAAVHYIAMELVPGETLREAIAGRRLDLKRALDLFAQAADALAAAHAAGIVHRDLKPENAIVAEGGYVKILDFGLAKLRAEPQLLQEASGQPTLSAATTPGVVMGTVGYMSPEQAQGRPVDHRSDVFSFGCMLYEAATGARAFGGTSAIDTLHQIINVDPPPLTSHVPNAPAELLRIVRKCLAKDPDARYQSMRDVAIDLRDLRRQLDSQVTSALVAVAAGPPRRGRTWAAVAIGVVLAAAGFAVWKFSGTRGAPPPSKPLEIQRVTGSGNVTDAMLSPDGRYLVHTESSGGRQSLWVRQLAGGRPLELVPGADVGYWGSRFSRDSTAIYYVIKSLKHPAGTLFRIPILGGVPQRILSGIDSTITLSPDGTHIAYLRADFPEPTASSVMVANADGSDARALATRKPPQFFAPGFFAAPSWSPDGKLIACAVRDSSSRDGRVVVVSVDGGAVSELPGRYADATFTQWLPDGAGILFVARALGTFGPGGGGQIWLQPYPAGDVRRVTNDLVDYRSISLSTDGTSLVTVGYDATAAFYVAQLDDLSNVPPGKPAVRDARKIPSDRYDGLGGLAWAPDGRRIFFGTQLRSSREIWMMEADGSSRREFVTESPSLWPRPSPDGSMVVFFGSRDNERGIWRVDADGSGRRLLAPLPDAMNLEFSPDGRWIYFTSGSLGSPGTWRLSADGGSPVLVAPLLERAGVSPDGAHVAGPYRASPTSPYSIAVLPAGGGTPVRAFPNYSTASGSGPLRWTADGQGLLYTSSERSNIWLQRLTGGPPQKITDYSDQTIFRFELSPDGRSLLMARGTQARDAFLITNFR